MWRGDTRPPVRPIRGLVLLGGIFGSYGTVEMQYCYTERIGAQSCPVAVSFTVGSYVTVYFTCRLGMSQVLRAPHGAPRESDVRELSARSGVSDTVVYFEVGEVFTTYYGHNLP